MKSKIKINFKIFFVIILILFISYYFIFNHAGKGNGKKHVVCFSRRGLCINAELALTPEERRLGLMYRKELGKKEGMLFIFPEEMKNSFWMKNTLIPLDIIWLDSKKKIIHISKEVPPCKVDICPSYYPPNWKKSMYVLEVNGGFSDEFGISVGDELEFENI